MWPSEQSRTNALNYPPLLVELVNRRKGRTGALVRAAALDDPQMLTIGIGVDPNPLDDL